MKKSEYVKYLQGNIKPPKKCEVNLMPSCCDPSFAQSGRDMVFNPKNYECKPIYSNGVPLDQMQPFDGMYKDKHIAFQAAKEVDTQQHEKVRDWKKQQKQPKKEETNETT